MGLAVARAGRLGHLHRRLVGMDDTVAKCRQAQRIDRRLLFECVAAGGDALAAQASGYREHAGLIVEPLADLLAHPRHGLAAAIGALGLVDELLARQMLWQRQAFERVSLGALGLCSQLLDFFADRLRVFFQPILQQTALLGIERLALGGNKIRVFHSPGGLARRWRTSYAEHEDFQHPC